MTPRKLKLSTARLLAVTSSLRSAHRIGWSLLRPAWDADGRAPRSPEAPVRARGARPRVVCRPRWRTSPVPSVCDDDSRERRPTTEGERHGVRHPRPVALARVRGTGPPGGAARVPRGVPAGDRGSRCVRGAHRARGRDVARAARDRRRGDDLTARVPYGDGRRDRARALRGRAILGLGTGAPRPGALDELRAQVAEIRASLDPGGRRERGDGRLGLDRPVPVWIAALGPRAVALAGETADGVLLNWCSPERVADASAAVRAAAERAGRDRIR